MPAVIVSSPRNQRVVPLTTLDIRLALGKVEMPGDGELIDEESSHYNFLYDDDSPDGFYDFRSGCFIPYFDDPLDRYEEDIYDERDWDQLFSYI